jgi:hypothetical protein
MTGEDHVLVCGASEDLLLVHGLQEQMARRQQNVEFHAYPLDLLNRSEDLARVRRNLERMLDHVTAVVWIINEHEPMAVWLDWLAERCRQRGMRLIGLRPYPECDTVLLPLVEHHAVLSEAEALNSVKVPVIRHRPVPRRVA